MAAGELAKRFIVEQMFKQGKKVVYALKEIRAGDQFEVEIYPQFKKPDTNEVVNEWLEMYEKYMGKGGEKE